MGGLEKITQQILEDAAQECARILEKANAECERIALEFRRSADERVGEIEASGAAEISGLMKSAATRAASDGKRQLQQAEQAVVSDVLEQALIKLQDRQSPAYFQTLTALLARHAHKQGGDILLCKGDIESMPPSFRAELEQRSLRVVEDEGVAGGGFVLRYGEIEENCAFSALFNEKKEAMRDKAYEILFAQRR